MPKPKPITEDDLDELVGWLRAQYLVGVGETTAAGIAAATRFAEQRAGEMVGMYKDPVSGRWRQAVRPEYRIGEDIRAGLQETVAEGIARGDSIGTIADALDEYSDISKIRNRAVAIARSEAARTMNVGTIAAGRDDGVELWDVIDGPGCLPTGHDDAADEPDKGRVGVQLDRQAHGQRWSSEDAARLATAHPNCVRYFEPVLPRDLAEAA